MAEKHSKEDPRKYLAAFADGELDVQDSLHVLEHMTMHPNATRRVMHQQQLRQMVGESMKDAQPKAPEALRDAVLAIADASDEAALPQPPGVLARIRPWALSAIAAMLLAAVVIQYMPNNAVQAPAPIESQQVSQSSVAEVPDAWLLGSQTVSSLTRRHVTCTRMINQMNQSVRFPENLEQMPAAISDFLQISDQSTPHQLDLTNIGYRYEEAGPCWSPGGKSVHMIYRPTRNHAAQDAISLWVQPLFDECSFSHIESDKVYWATSDEAAHPMVVWRHNGMIYYLVGDSPQAVKDASNVLLVSG